MKQNRIWHSLPFIYFAIILSAGWQLLYLLVTGQLGDMGGREMPDIAERIVSGAGYSSPYLAIGEGEATRVSPPLYVWFTASVYSLLGIKTDLAHATLQMFNIFFNLLTLVMLYRVTKHWFDRFTAQIFALIFCLHPFILLITRSTWETGMTLCLLSAILWYLTFHFNRDRFWDLAVLGILFGVTALSNPAWTIAYPLLCLVLLWPKSWERNWRDTIVKVATIFICYLLVVSPWLLRNYSIENKLGYIRNMSGPELFKGNHHEAGGGHGKGFYDYWIYNSTEERERYQAMGEGAYDRWMSEQAVQIIKADPLHYLKLTFVRIGMWWSGDVDVLRKWHEVGNRKKFLFGIVLLVSGVVTSFCLFAGTWLLRKQWKEHWILWLYIYLLPIPYYLIIVGFRYQASLIAFSMIPASYFVARMLGKSRFNSLSSES